MLKDPTFRKPRMVRMALLLLEKAEGVGEEEGEGEAEERETRLQLPGNDQEVRLKRKKASQDPSQEGELG